MAVVDLQFCFYVFALGHWHRSVQQGSEELYGYSVRKNYGNSN